MEELKQIGIKMLPTLNDEFVDEEIYCGNTIAGALSPTTNNFLSRFDSLPDECVISNYSCTLCNKIPLHGNLYLTSMRLCFYSMYNERNFLFSSPTKLVISFDQINLIQKCCNSLLYDNCIKIVYSEGEAVFSTFTKRDSTYDLIYQMVSINSQSFQIEDESDETKPSLNLNDELGSELEGSDKPHKWQFDKNILERLNDIAYTNTQELSKVDEEFLEENFKEFTTLLEEIYEGVDLTTVYYLIYGDYKDKEGNSFLHDYIDKSGSTNISEKPRETEIPKYFAHKKDKKNANIKIDDEILKTFEHIQHSKSYINYDCEISILNMKSICNVHAVCHSIFLSPLKIYILTKLGSTGSKYSEYFTPITLSILDQINDCENKTISVKQTFMVGVKFHKPIMFFQGKVQSLIINTLKKNIEQIMVPMIKECIEKYKEHHKIIN